MLKDNMPLFSNVDGSKDISDNIDLYYSYGDGTQDFAAFFKAIDSDGDGYFDTIYKVCDFNNDGIADLEQIFGNINGDGTAEMIMQTQYVGNEQNEIIASISFAKDAKGDGYFYLSSIDQDINMDVLFEIAFNSLNFLTPDINIHLYDSSSVTDAAENLNEVEDPAYSMDNWYA